jgi:hypothetical protein
MKKLMQYIVWIGFLIAHVAFGYGNMREKIETFYCDAYRHFTVNQRMLIAQTIQEYAHCNLLISTTGLDSGLWMEINACGNTHFLEHDQFWIDLCTKKFPGINIIKVEYDTRFAQWHDLLHSTERSTLMPRSPVSLLSYDYDVIIIDGPESHPTMPTTVDLIGRMQVFFLAAELFLNTQKTVHLFVHDTDREMEQVATDTLIGATYLVWQEDNLRYYRNK